MPNNGAMQTGRISMKKISFVTSIIASLALLAPLSLFADGHEEADAAPAPLTEAWMVVPKAGMMSDFIKAATADAAIRQEKGDTRSWQAYTVAVGDNLNIVQFRACCFNWADQDTYMADSMEKGLGQNWQDNVHQYVDHYHHYFEYNDWENSHWPDGEGDGPYYVVTSWAQKQGAGPEAGEARKKMSQLAIEGDWEGNWLWLFRIGGKPTTSIVSSFANFADMAPPEKEFSEFVGEQLGEEGAAALFSDFASGFSGSEYTIWKHHEGMSNSDADEE
jgi:hypothetical protein